MQATCQLARTDGKDLVQTNAPRFTPGGPKVASHHELLQDVISAMLNSERSAASQQLVRILCLSSRPVRRSIVRKHCGVGQAWPLISQGHSHVGIERGNKTGVSRSQESNSAKLPPTIQNTLLSAIRKRPAILSRICLCRRSLTKCQCKAELLQASAGVG